MDDTINVKESFEIINTNLINENDILELKKQLRERFDSYQKTMRYMMADIPIQALCLDKTTEKILLDNGLLRVYDFFDLDLVKIKGIGPIRARNLAASLDQFFSVL